jgi:vancomycin resistance protein YoaR
MISYSWRTRNTYSVGLSSTIGRFPVNKKALVLFVILVLTAFFISTTLQAEPSYSYLWGGFSTSLEGRRPEQRSNAARAGLDLDGRIILPGRTLSFNDCVGGRDVLKGYTPAPTINNRGTLSEAPGGGICQLATTIYNAALEAGMEIVERHPHSRFVGYVPPGRDATIQTWRKDLKLKNPHAVPLLLKIKLNEKRLTAAFWSLEPRPFKVHLLADILAVEPETVVSRHGNGAGASQDGMQGFSVITRRTIIKDGVAREEIVSCDEYPAATRILGGDEGGIGNRE